MDRHKYANYIISQISIANFDINDVNAGLYFTVVVRTMPITILYSYISKPINRKTAPIRLRTGYHWPFTSTSAKLIEKSLLPSVFCANSMRTQLSGMTIIGSKYLLLLKNCILD